MQVSGCAPGWTCRCEETNGISGKALRFVIFELVPVIQSVAGRRFAARPNVADEIGHDKIARRSPQQQFSGQFLKIRPCESADR
jgi:hypothetical protein